MYFPVMALRMPITTSSASERWQSEGQVENSDLSDFSDVLDTRSESNLSQSFRLQHRQNSDFPKLGQKLFCFGQLLGSLSFLTQISPGPARITQIWNYFKNCKRNRVSYFNCNSTFKNTSLTDVSYLCFLSQCLVSPSFQGQSSRVLYRCKPKTLTTQISDLLALPKFQTI